MDVYRNIYIIEKMYTDMSKRKVTLSVDSKVYDSFRKFCEERAIMLSKKVELVMKKIMEAEK